MSKTPETLDLESRLRIYTQGQFGCDEVTIGPFGHERVDFMTLDWRGIWRCFEVKVSKADFRSKAKKSFVGNLNYFVMPKDLYEEVRDEIEPDVGVIVPDRGASLVSVQKAKRHPLAVDEKRLMTSLIRSLFRTYSDVMASGEDVIVKRLRGQIAQLRSDLRRRNEDSNSAKMDQYWMSSFLRHRGLKDDFEIWRESRESGDRDG